MSEAGASGRGRLLRSTAGVWGCGRGGGPRGARGGGVGVSMGLHFGAACRLSRVWLRLAWDPCVPICASAHLAADSGCSCPRALEGTLHRRGRGAACTGPRGSGLASADTVLRSPLPALPSCRAGFLGPTGLLSPPWGGGGLCPLPGPRHVRWPLRWAGLCGLRPALGGGPAELSSVPRSA